jgi:hypothetical protein
MSWTQQDTSFKKLQSKRITTSTGKGINEEKGASTLELYLPDIKTELIPGTPPGASTSVLAYTGGIGQTLAVDTSVPSNLTWFATTGFGNTTVANDGTQSSEEARLMSWISDKYDAFGTISGAGYEVKLYDKNSNLITKTDPSDWLFDYQTGILTFNNASTAYGTVATSGPYRIVGYRYIGSKGIISASYGGLGYTTYTKGDLLVGAGSTFIKLNVGSNDYILTADSSTPSGLKWVVNSGSGAGVSVINGLSATTQFFAVGSSGTEFNISSSGSTHTFNIPIAGTGSTGLISTLAQTIAGSKTFTSAIIGDLSGTATTSTYAYQSGYAITSGIATTSNYAYQSGYAVTSGLATTSEYSYQSGYAITSGLATTATYAYQSGYGITSGFATTANYSYQSGYGITSGFATTAGLATTSTYAHQSGYAITSGLATTANYAHQSGYAVTSGLATTANYAHQSGYAITSGLATTANYAHQSGFASTAGLATTATYSYQSGYGITSGFATTAANINISNVSTGTFYPVLSNIFSSASGVGASVSGLFSFNASNGAFGATSVSIFTGQSYSIGGNSVLFATSLGTGVTNSSLTALGTITTGTWTGSLIAALYGGTGLVPSFTVGDILYANTSSTWGRLPANSNSGYVLTSAGSGATPTYIAPSALSVGFATTSSYAYQSGYAITSGLATTATYSHQSGYAITSGLATTASYAHQSGYAITSGFATTAGLATTATYAHQSGYAITSGFATSSTSASIATTSTNINVVSATTSASHPVLFTPATGTASGAAVSTESSFVYNPSTDILSVSGLAVTSGIASTNSITGALVVTGGVGIGGSLFVGGDLTINGTTTTINSVTLTVDDKNIELGSVSSPSDVTAEGGGITLKGTTDKFINWYTGTGWSSSDSLNLASGNAYKINNTAVLSASSLGTGVTNSSLTALGTITTGVWTGTTITGLYGGTGYTTYTKGDLLVGAGSTFIKLAVGSDNFVLTASSSSATGLTWSPTSATGITSLNGLSSSIQYFSIGYSGTDPSFSSSGSTHTLNIPIAGTGVTGLITGITQTIAGQKTFTSAIIGDLTGTATTAGFATTANYSLQSGYAITSGLATTATYAYQSGYAITAGLATTATYSHQSGYAITAGSSGLATTATYAHQSGYAITAGLATTATYSYQSGYGLTSGLATTATYAHQSGYAITSGFATTSANINVVNAVTNSAHPLHFSPVATGSGVAVSSNTAFSFNPSTLILSTSGLAVTTSTVSTSSSTGALVVTGGVGIGGSVYTATDLNVGNSTTGRLYFSQATLGSAGTTVIPSMAFIGSTNSPITLSVLADNSLSFDGSSGQLFSINNNLSTGYIFAVNDISGLPLLRANADGTVTMGEFAGNIGIGLSNPSYKLHVAGDTNLSSGYVYRINGTSVLSASSLGTGVTNSSLTALGTITTGTWSGSIISGLYGGTGYTSYSKGDILVGAGSTFIKLNVGTDNFVLTADNTTATGVKWSSVAGLSITSVNGLTASAQFFSTGVSGTGFNISSSGSTHTFNIPIAGTGSTGLVSTQSQSFAGIKTFTNAVSITDTTGSSSYTSGALVVTGGVGIGGTLNVQGDLNIQGTFTTINSTTVNVADKNIELGVVATPTDITAQGGGITLRGATDKSINWYSGVGWSSSESWNLASGNTYKIGGTTVLSATSLGTGVTNSSLTALGTVSTGVWAATAITALYGGTGLVPTFTVGDILYANTENTWERLAASSNSGYLLASAGSGATPTYVAPSTLSVGFATTSNYSYQSGYAITSGSATSAGLATTATYAHQSGYAITSGSSATATTATYAHQSGYAITSGIATTANYAYQSGYAITSGLATTATYAHQSGYAITSGSSATATTATYAHQSGYAITSGLATTASNINLVNVSSGTFYPILSNTSSSVNGIGASVNSFFSFNASTGAFGATSVNILAGQSYSIGGNSVLSATSLGTGVTNSSLTALGTITTGTWAGSLITGLYGGTGYNSYSKGDILVGAGSTFIKVGSGSTNYILSSSSIYPAGVGWTWVSAVGVGTNPPNDTHDSDLWWNSDDGSLNFYYNDGDTSQWVEIAGGSGIDLSQPIHITSGTASTSTLTGALIVDGGVGVAGTVYASSFSINGVYDQISSTLVTSNTNANQVALSIDVSSFRTAKMFVQVTSGSNYHSQEILMVHDDSQVYMTEYAMVNTGAIGSTFDGDISGGNMRFLVTPTNAVTTYKIACSAMRI